MKEDNKNIIYFVYDGQCPICQLGAAFYKVRKNSGEVISIDARTQLNHQIIKEINQANLDLDEGMVIKYQNNLYQGSEALHLMAKLGADEGFLNRINNSLYQHKMLASLCYPFMKVARNLLLKIKNVGKINNLKK